MAAKKKNKNEVDTADTHSLPDHTKEQPARSQKNSPDLAEQSKEQLINKLQDLQIHLKMQAEELRISHLALEVSRDKYLDLYDFAPLGYLTLNDNALITDVNLTGAMLFGAERNEIINDRFERFIAPLDFEIWSQFFANLRSQHVKKQVCTLMFIREDGSTFPAQLEGVRTISSDGAIEIHIAISDITEIREAEKALRESEEKYRNIFENSVAGLFKTNPDGALNAVNDAFARIYDYSSAAEMTADNQKRENLYISSTLYANPEDRKEIYRILAEKGKVENFETLHCKRDGTRIWISITARVVCDPDGTVLFVEGTIIDITKRKTAEEALRESENRYRTLIENMPDGIILHSPSGKILYANSSVASLLHIQDPGVLTGKNVQDFVDPDYRDKVSARMKDAVEKGDPIPLQEEVLIRSDGTRVTVENQGCRVLFRGEYATQVVVRDITERKVAEEELLESEERFRLLLQHVPSVSVQGYSMDGTTQYWNDASESLYGYTAQEAVGKNLVDLVIPPEMKDDVRKAMTYMAESGQPIPAAELSLMRKDGTRVAVFSSHTIVKRSWSGTELFCIDIDLTERKVVEEALRNAHERLRCFVDANIVGIVFGSSSGKIIDANDYYLNIIGYTREEFEKGMVDWRAITPPEWLPADERAIEELRKRGKCTPYEKEYLRRDGTRVPVSISNALLPGPEEYIAAFIVDITDRKRAEEAIHQANKKLTLLSGITRHDINNQLTVLRGYLAILEKKQPDPTLNEYFSKVSIAAQRIASMIQFTKEYESIGVNAPVWQDCRTLVDTAAKQAPLGKIIVKNNITAGAEVFADPLIVKVCYNLMDNAVRYGGKITTIRFSFEEHGGDHVLVCEDDGDGVVAEEKEKIFERGFGKNTGLGLALSREILSITGITICETGEPGKGARFEMAVPKGAWK